MTNCDIDANPEAAREFSPAEQRASSEPGYGIAREAGASPWLARLATGFLVLLVQTYRLLLSPLKSILFGELGRCRFTPSCSEYALQALRAHGALMGTWLSVKRIGRCHPWGGCGHDPIPTAKHGH